MLSKLMGKQKYTEELIGLINFAEENDVSIRYTNILHIWIADVRIESKGRVMTMEIRNKNLQKLLEEVREEYEK